VYGHKVNDGIRIAELAKQTGVSTSALRYYEAQGLLSVDARTEAGYRVYRSQAVGRVGFIRRAKALGLSLGEIRRLLQEPSEGSEHTRIRHAIAHKLAETEIRIGHLETLRAELLSMQERLGGVTLACGRIGDCGCWLPNQEEAEIMANIGQGCECCGCTCEPDADGCCSCCGCGGGK
jgi:MerR family copper efflux transcriptional regulator